MRPTVSNDPNTLHPGFTSQQDLTLYLEYLDWLLALLSLLLVAFQQQPPLQPLLHLYTTVIHNAI